MSDWSCLESLAKVPRWCTWIQRFHTIPIPMFQKALKQILFNAVEHMVLCARVFIHAHAEAQHNISESIKVPLVNMFGCVFHTTPISSEIKSLRFGFLVMLAANRKRGKNASKPICKSKGCWRVGYIRE